MNLWGELKLLVAQRPFWMSFPLDVPAPPWPSWTLLRGMMFINLRPGWPSTLIYIILSIPANINFDEKLWTERGWSEFYEPKAHSTVNTTKRVQGLTVKSRASIQHFCSPQTYGYWNRPSEYLTNGNGFPVPGWSSKSTPGSSGIINAAALACRRVRLFKKSLLKHLRKPCLLSEDSITEAQITLAAGS